MSPKTEIYEQPEALERLPAKQQQKVGEIAELVRARGVRLVPIAASGSSGEAGQSVSGG